VHPLREQVKRFLIGTGQRCALCGGVATSLHEVVCSLRHKYDPVEEDEPLARIVYLPQNCVLLSPRCNVEIGGGASRRDDLIAFNMELYGVTAVVGCYRSMAKLLKSPTSWIPSTVTFKGKEVRIL